MGSNIIVIATLIFLLFSAVVLCLMLYSMKNISPSPTPYSTKPTLSSNDKQPQSSASFDTEIVRSRSPSYIDDNTQAHTDSVDITVTLNLADVQNFIKASAEIIYNGKVYSIDSDHYTMGHDKGCNLTVTERAVSGRHCKIDYKDNTFTLSDLHSKNGTYLNGEPVTKSMELHNGDEIRMGFVAVKFKRRSGDDNYLTDVQVAEWGDPLDGD